MSGIEGLKLLNTKYITTFSQESVLIVLTLGLICVGAFIIGISFLSNIEWEGFLVSLIVIIISIIIMRSPIIKYKGYRKYTLSIENNNYHIDLDKYEILKKDGKEIIIQDKID